MTGTTITPNGVSYVVPDDLTQNNGAGHSESVVAGTGETLPRLFAIMSDYLASSAKQMRTTSTSSVAIGTGTKTFVLATDIPFVAGERGVAIDTANASNYMYFTVTSYTSSTKTLVTYVASGDTGGSGTIASWNIASSGQKGDTGATGATFDASAMTAETAFANLTYITGSIGAGSANNIKITPANLFTGINVPISLTDQNVSRAQFKDCAEPAYSLGNISGAVAIDYTNGQVQYGTLTGNITSITVSNWPASGNMGYLSLFLMQDGTGSRTLTLSSAYKTVGDAAATLSTAASYVDELILRTRDAGTTIYTTLVKDYR